jgi:hypothetical protein
VQVDAEALAEQLCRFEAEVAVRLRAAGEPDTRRCRSLG